MLKKTMNLDIITDLYMSYLLIIIVQILKSLVAHLCWLTRGRRLCCCWGVSLGGRSCLLGMGPAPHCCPAPLPGMQCCCLNTPQNISLLQTSVNTRRCPGLQRGKDTFVRGVAIMKGVWILYALS